MRETHETTFHLYDVRVARFQYYRVVELNSAIIRAEWTAERTSVYAIVVVMEILDDKA